MDNLFERFLRKIGIQDVTLFDDCRFLSQKYNKQTDLLTIEIESGSYFTYTEGKMLLDAIDHAPFKIDVNFTYKKGYGETEIFQLLRDEFISKTGFSSTEMPRYECKKNVITFFFYGRLHKDSVDGNVTAKHFFCLVGIFFVEIAHSDYFSVVGKDTFIKG